MINSSIHFKNEISVKQESYDINLSAGIEGVESLLFSDSCLPCVVLQEGCHARYMALGSIEISSPLSVVSLWASALGSHLSLLHSMIKPKAIEVKQNYPHYLDTVFIQY